MNVTVVGGGIAGLICARQLLAQGHEVRLLEQKPYLGGAAHAFVTDDGVPVDTGVVFFHESGYPRMFRLVRELGLRWRTMEHSVALLRGDDVRLFFPGQLRDYLAGSARLPASDLSLLVDYPRFVVKGARDQRRGGLAHITIGDYLQREGYRRPFAELFTSTMAGIHSLSLTDYLGLPADFALDMCFSALGLFGRNPFSGRHLRNVSGGCHAYVQRLSEALADVTRTGVAVEQIDRSRERIAVRTSDGSSIETDAVVLAILPDRCVELLAPPTAEERALLEDWRSAIVRSTVHSDARVLAANPRHRAIWNHQRVPATLHSELHSATTVWMNKLHGTAGRRDYFVSLETASDARLPIARDQIVAEVSHTVPLQTRGALDKQRDLPRLNARGRTFFCGSWFGAGTHEDAIASAQRVAECIGPA